MDDSGPAAVNPRASSLLPLSVTQYLVVGVNMYSVSLNVFWVLTNLGGTPVSVGNDTVQCAGGWVWHAAEYWD